MLTLSGLLIQMTQLNLVITIFEHLNVKFLIVSKFKKKKKTALTMQLLMGKLYRYEQLLLIIIYVLH